MDTVNNIISTIVNEAAYILSIEEPLDYAVRQVISNNKINGLYLEFGVFQGASISRVANLLSDYDWNIYGFDSFDGLPEFWRDGFGKGSFNLNGNIPKLKQNIHLFKGLFKDSIPVWLNESQSFNKVDILHIDCDLYSSTKDILTLLSYLINVETIIVFDELINYNGFEDHEIKAFAEFIIKHGYKFQVVASGGYNKEKVAIKIMSRQIDSVQIQ